MLLLLRAEVIALHCADRGRKVLISMAVGLLASGDDCGLGMEPHRLMKRAHMGAIEMRQ